MFYTDENRLMQILLNLLSNSLKFTTSGFIKLTISDVNDSIKFEVEDSGIGIHQEDQDNLLTEFAEVENKQT